MFSNKEIIGYHVFENWRAFNLITPKLSDIYGYTIRQQVICMDVQNFGFSSFGGNEKGTVTATITFGGNSIPENSYKNIVVNTPMLARTAYSVGKYMLDEGMRAKMSINGSD